MQDYFKAICASLLAMRRHHRPPTQEPCTALYPRLAIVRCLEVFHFTSSTPFAESRRSIVINTWPPGYRVNASEQLSMGDTAR